MIPLLYLLAALFSTITSHGVVALLAGGKVSNPSISGRACFEKIFGPPPGQFCTTTHGSTHYRLQGRQDDPLVILQHGIGSDLGRFDAIADDLVAIGYRVLRYDLYDRGYSETFPEQYPIQQVGVHPLKFTMELHVEQLRDILTLLGLENVPLVHCGHSMGGLVGVAYTANYPQHIQGLVLMDAVCLPVKKPLIARIADLPILGNVLAAKFGVQTFVEFSKKSVVDAELPQVQEFLAKQAQNARTNPRFFASLRSTNGNCRGMVGSAEDEFRKCCQQESSIPIHLIWGQADASAPYENCLQMREIASELGAVVTEDSYEGMPHNVFFADAKPKEVSKSICNFVSNVFSQG